MKLVAYQVTGMLGKLIISMPPFWCHFWRHGCLSKRLIIILSPEINSAPQKTPSLTPSMSKLAQNWGFYNNKMMRKMAFLRRKKVETLNGLYSKRAHQIFLIFSVLAQEICVVYGPSGLVWCNFFILSTSLQPMWSAWRNRCLTNVV